MTSREITTCSGRNLWRQQSADFCRGRSAGVDRDRAQQLTREGRSIEINTVINGELNGGADIDCFSLEGKTRTAAVPGLQGRADREPAGCDDSHTDSGGDRAGRESRRIRSRPVSGCDAAGRRPVRDQGSRRHLRRVARPFLSLDDSRRPASGCDSASGDRARLALGLTLIGRGLGPARRSMPRNHD